MRFSSYSGMEQRSFVRVPAEMRVSVISWDGTGTQRNFPGVTRNVSAGGLCVELEEFDKAYWKRLRDPNPNVDLRIAFSNSKPPVKAKGVVKWASVKKGRPPVMMLGLQFIGLDQVGKALLVDLIEKQYLLDFKMITGGSVKKIV